MPLGGHGAAQVDIGNEYIFNKCYLQFCGMFGQIANAVFILIMGYFQVDNKFNKKRFLRLVLDIEFYSVTLFALMVAVGKTDFSIRGLVTALLPFIYTAYWFVIPYLAIYILSPYLNIWFENLSPRQLGVVIGFMLLVNNIFPLVGAFTISSNFFLFIMYYFIGAVIKRKTFRFFEVIQKNAGKFLVGIELFLIISIVVLDLVGSNVDVAFKLTKLLIGRFSIFTTLVAVGMFLIAIREEMKMNKVINKIAQSTLAVYLISENENVYPWLFVEWFNNKESFSSFGFIVESLAVAFLIMCVCLCIDFLKCLCVNVTVSYLCKKAINK